MDHRNFFKTVLIATPLVTIIIFVAPIFVYGLFQYFRLTEMPGDSPVWFLVGVFVSKLGTAIAFVAFFTLAPSELGKNWWAYALIWFLMFALDEIGQAIGPNYPWGNAVAGILSEAFYFPLSAVLLSRLNSIQRK